VSRHPLRAAHAQRGVAAVEFAFASLFFFTLLFGVIEMGRMLWAWNAAVEATRLGARTAVVCDINDPDIKAKMRQRLPTLTDSNITITYIAPGLANNTCDDGTCREVRVSLTGYQHDTIIPFLPLTVTLPPFSTSLRKEFMKSAGNDAICT
jgi:Flp pilus assembly protein TadG